MTLRQVLYWLLYWLRCGPIQCLSEYSKYIKHMGFQCPEMKFVKSFMQYERSTLKPFRYLYPLLDLSWYLKTFGGEVFVNQKSSLAAQQSRVSCSCSVPTALTLLSATIPLHLGRSPSNHRKKNPRAALSPTLSCPIFYRWECNFTPQPDVPNGRFPPIQCPTSKIKAFFFFMRISVFKLMS